MIANTYICWQVVRDGLEKGRVQGYKKEAEVHTIRLLTKVLVVCFAGD